MRGAQNGSYQLCWFTNEASCDLIGFLNWLSPVSAGPFTPRKASFPDPAGRGCSAEDQERQQ